MLLLPALLLQLLTATASASSFTCTEPSICKSAIGYIVLNATTYAKLISHFNTCTLQDLFLANNLTSTTAPQDTILAQTTVTIPFTCHCDGNGTGQSDQKPIYTVQSGDTFYSIANYEFGGFVTFQDVQIANAVHYTAMLELGWNLWIPLPCSCDKVDGSDVMHFAYSVGKDENTSQVAAKFGVSESMLRRVNNIQGSNLTMGQILDVPLAARKVTLSWLRAVIIGVVLTMAILAVLVWFSLSWYRWKRTRDCFARGITGLKRFHYSVLAMATDKFSEEKRLGEGAFGTVYRGSLMDENGMEQKVAVKKMKNTTGENNDFLAEINAISSTTHMNLVSLKGWSCSRTMMDVMRWSMLQNVRLFLVYELVPNSSLDYHLHRSGQVLTWPKRYKIVKGIVSALHYLHHEREPYILHRDIKPSNILLDDEFNPKLADFGLSRIANHNSTTLPTLAIGTVGYIDPQCRKNGLVKFGRHSDVYSFGIVLLDIACTDKTREKVWELYSGSAEPQVDMAADSKLCGDFDRNQMERVVVLGLRCSDPDRDMRPSMLDAMQFLEQGIELPAIIKNEDAQLEVSIAMSAESSSELLP